MDISFYTAAVGVHQQQRRLDVHANNIANVNTQGYRARRPSFSALMTGPIRGINEDLPRGVGARLEADEIDFEQSALRETGLQLDYAIRGKGFFGLLDPVSGEYSYTRDGSFTLMSVVETVTPEDPDQPPEDVTRWYLSDGLGRYVLGRDGRTIEVQDPAQAELRVGNPLPIGIFDFINRNGMKSVGDNRFTPVDKNGEVGLGEGTLVQGYVEMSNTDLAYELSKVIESQRSFQYILRMVTTSDEITSTVNGLR